MVSGGGGFNDHKGFGGFQGSEHTGKKLSVVFGESLVRNFLGKVFQWLDISCRSRSESIGYLILHRLLVCSRIIFVR